MAAGDASLPYPVRNTAFRITVPILDADGDLVTGAAGLDSEYDLDGAGFSDCAAEATEIGTTGLYYLDLAYGELNGSTAAIQVKTSTSGAKTTPMILYPRVLPVLLYGTAQAVAAGSITLAAGASGLDLAGCIVRVASATLGTGQGRVVTAYDAGTQVATVVPNWGTTPTGAVTYEVLATEAWVARRADVRTWLGTAAAVPNTAGVPVVDVTSVEGTDATDALDARIVAGVADLPTNAELATALGTAEDAVLAAIAALNNLSSAGAQAAAAAALAAYGASTYAGGDTAGTTTLLSRIVGTLAAGTHQPQSGDAYADTQTLLSRVTGAVALATSTAATAIRAALGMAAADLDDQLDAVLVAAAGGSTLGSGSEAVRIYVDDDGGNPVDGAAVWITTDEAGSNVVAGTVHTLGTGYTPVLMLDPGTYYVWKQANSINFTNPSAITVVDA